MGENDVNDKIVIEPHLRDYADRLVATGKAPSLSAVVNLALQDRFDREQKAAAVWRAKTAEVEADPERSARVTRLTQHLAAEMARFTQRRAAS